MPAEDAADTFVMGGAGQTMAAVMTGPARILCATNVTYVKSISSGLSSELFRCLKGLLLGVFVQESCADNQTGSETGSVVVVSRFAKENKLLSVVLIFK